MLSVIKIQQIDYQCNIRTNCWVCFAGNFDTYANAHTFTCVCIGHSDSASDPYACADTYTRAPNPEWRFFSGTSPCVLPVTRVDRRENSEGNPDPITQQLLAAWSESVGVDIVGQAERLG